MATARVTRPDVPDASKADGRAVHRRIRRLRSPGRAEWRSLFCSSARAAIDNYLNGGRVDQRLDDSRVQDGRLSSCAMA
jgi:hypothetical protein